MLVTVEVYGTPIHVIPAQDGVVKEDEIDIFIFQRMVVLHPFEEGGIKCRLIPKSIVIAPDEVFLAVKDLECAHRKIGALHCKIAEDVDLVLGLNALIPVPNQDLIHLFNIRKRAFRVRYGVCVKEMLI